jgi:DNA polymerase mu
MPFKRPSRTRDSSVSSSNTGPRLKRVRSQSPSEGQASSNTRLTDIAIYIVQTKLNHEITAELFRIAEGDQVFVDPSGKHHGVRFHLCHDVGEAEVIVTAVHMRRRLERHIDWEIAVRSSSLSLPYPTALMGTFCM